MAPIQRQGKNPSVGKHAVQTPEVDLSLPPRKPVRPARPFRGGLLDRRHARPRRKGFLSRRRAVLGAQRRKPFLGAPRVTWNHRSTQWSAFISRGKASLDCTRVKVAKACRRLPQRCPERKPIGSVAGCHAGLKVR